MPKCGEIIKNMLLGLAGTVVMICLAVSLTVWFRPLLLTIWTFRKAPACPQSFAG